jgi:hypothetical protein
MALEEYRDKQGELSRKYEKILVGTLSSHYGSNFALGCSESNRLTEANLGVSLSAERYWFHYWNR